MNWVNNFDYAFLPSCLVRVLRNIWDSATGAIINLMSVIEEEQEHKPKRVTSKAVTIFGVIALVVGLGTLGYIGWEYFGGNWKAKQESAAAVSEIERAWADDIDPEAIGLLRISEFSEGYVQPVIPGFTQDVFRRGIGWDENSVMPGEVGNFIIAGHRTFNGQPFLSLPELKRGDLVEVETRTHLYVYKLRTNGDQIRVTYDKVWPLQQVPEEGAAGKKPTEALMTMITCSELFSSPWRTVVIAELDQVIEKPAAQTSN